jgi:hypothetical protein
VASIFHKIPKEWARFLQKAKEMYHRLFLCENLKNQQYFGHPIFTKMSQESVFVLRRTKIRFPIVICEKCESPKVFRISGSSFLIFVDFPNDQCAFNRGALCSNVFPKKCKNAI